MQDAPEARRKVLGDGMEVHGLRVLYFYRFVRSERASQVSKVYIVCNGYQQDVDDVLRCRATLKPYVRTSTEADAIASHIRIVVVPLWGRYSR